MKESTLLKIYCPMLVIPFWFIIYTLHRLRRHWNDGRDKTFSQVSATLAIKYLLVLSLAGLTAVNLALVVFIEQEEFEDIQIIKITLFSSLMVSWIMSYVMLKLEFKLRLRMKWLGHRSYWPINLAIFSVLVVKDMNEINWEIKKFFKVGNIINIVSFIICLFLTCLAVVKPNEFSKNKDEVSANLIKKARFSSGARFSTPEDRGLAGAVHVSIKNYKIKVENTKQIVLYNITVKIKGEVYKIRRTYYEFDKLYKAIRKSFPLEVFPYMSFPSFPIFSGMNFSLEQKTFALNEFLIGLCCPEFMLQETLDFLNIKGNFREKLLEEHLEILEAEKAVTITEADECIYGNRDSFSTDNRISVFEKSSKVHTHFHNFFQIKLTVCESLNNKPEYTLTWVIPSTTDHFEVTKRFRDFSTLNNSLKKSLNPALLPKFPEKSYVQNLRKVDSKGLEIRRRKLEKYLSHVLNDPGFLCQDLLDFIGCQADLFSLLDRPCSSEYELNGPVGWEGELEGSSSYIIYVLSFAKYFEGEKIAEWSVKRGFKDFEYMDHFLCKRTKSPMFLVYLNLFKQKLADWPKLPNKHPTSLSNPTEIEVCRSEIQNYMEELCSVTLISTAYAFKSFIDDPDSKF
jgi:hypothetical protein